MRRVLFLATLIVRKSKLSALLIVALAGAMLLVSTSVWALTVEEEAKLLASEGASSDHFGNSVAIKGDTAIIGAWADDDNGENSGSATCSG